MSELTDRVRKMLSQAQVFARDTPFEGVARSRQALLVVEEALAGCKAEERMQLEGLRTLAMGRVAKYEAALQDWLQKAEQRGERFGETERYVLQQPLRVKPRV